MKNKLIDITEGVGVGKVRTKHTEPILEEETSAANNTAAPQHIVIMCVDDLGIRNR